MSKSRLPMLVLLLLILTTNMIYAQDGGTPTPTPELTPALTPDPLAFPVYTLPVTVTAPDNWTLVGDLYLIDAARPTVLLLHQLYTDRHSWEPVVIPALLAAGYNALAVDVRGHGETAGTVNWGRAITDVQVWVDWLRSTGVNNTIFLMGSSMGSTLALVGCGNDPFCQGVIAISPGWGYYEVSVERTFSTLLGERPALIIYAARDPWPAYGVPKMVEAATGEVKVLEYPGNAHGMDLFNAEETLIASILDWLNTHTG